MGMRRTVLTGLFTVLTLVTSGCGDDTETATVGSDADPSSDDAAPTSDGLTADPDDDDETAAPAPITSAADDDPIVGCPSGPTFPLSAVDNVPPVTEAPDGVEAAMDTFLGGEEGAFWPQAGWRVLHETPEQVLAVHVGDRSTAAEAGLSFMTLINDGTEWIWAGASSGSDCPLQFQLDEGLGEVEWRLDPEYPAPGPDDTTAHILAKEGACASAQPMGDRLNEPVVLADASQVSITLSVVPLEGGQECPGNPDMAVEVDLGEPLGDRRLVDGRDVGVELEDLLPPA